MKSIISAAMEYVMGHKEIKILIALIVSLGSLYATFSAARSVEYGDLIREYKEQAQISRDELKACVDMNQELLLENYKLDQERKSAISLQFDSPLPRWFKIMPCKNCQPVMRLMNNSFKNFYLIPMDKTAEEYEGKTDIEFWGDELGQVYLQEDMTVINTQASIDQYTVDPFTGKRDLRVIKYPIRLPGGEIIGVGGVAIRPMSR